MFSTNRYVLHQSLSSARLWPKNYSRKSQLSCLARRHEIVPDHFMPGSPGAWLRSRFVVDGNSVVRENQRHRHKTKGQNHRVQFVIADHLAGLRSESEAVSWRTRSVRAVQEHSQCASFFTLTRLRFFSMRPPSLEEILFQKLMSSHVFHSWVRRVHARINRIPLEEQSPETGRHMHLHDYSPTPWHRANAFRVLLWDELKKAFTFRS